MATKLSEDIAEGLAEFLKSLPKPPKDGVTEEHKAARTKRAAIKAAAHKTKRNAYYVVGREGAYRDGRLYAKGEIITLPLDEDPSHTFKPASPAHLGAAAAAEAKRKAEEAELVGADVEDDDGDVEPPAGDDGEDAADDEAPEVDQDEAEEPDADEEPAAPAPKKPKAGKAKPKAGKATPAGSKRASDTDVA